MADFIVAVRIAVCPAGQGNWDFRMSAGGESGVARRRGQWVLSTTLWIGYSSSSAHKQYNEELAKLS